MFTRPQTRMTLLIALAALAVLLTVIVVLSAQVGPLATDASMVRATAYRLEPNPRVRFGVIDGGQAAPNPRVRFDVIASLPLPDRSAAAGAPLQPGPLRLKRG